MLRSTSPSSDTTEKMKIRHLLQGREEASTAPPTSAFFTNMDSTPAHPPHETGCWNSRSFQLLETHAEDFPTPESLHTSSPEELCRVPSVPQPPDDEELTELCNFFLGNLLKFIPIIRTEDIGSYGDMAREGQRLLAHSMAYVAAGFVPGCKPIRARLAPFIFAYLEQCALEGNEESRWTALQAVAVLYNWTTPNFHVDFSDRVVQNPPLTHNALRAIWDKLVLTTTPLEVSEDVARLLEQYPMECTIRKHRRVWWYLCCLWMHATIHYRTWLIDPGNVFKADPGIYTCKYIFRDYLTDHVIGPIVAQVELCCIRERFLDAGHRIDSSQQPLTMLKEMNDAVDSWHREWSRQWTNSGSYEPLEVYYHFTRFCISVQASRLYQSCSTSEISPSAGLSLIETSVERVCDLCSVFTNLNPLSSYSLCFVPEDVFALVICGCEYVLGVQTTLHNLKLLNTHQLVSLRAIAELMLAVATYDKEWAASQGATLLRRLSTRLSGQRDNQPSDASPAPLITSS
ncbi:hypothetical protein PV05_03071 [Exophiala xenobiotica]|uniref:Transcription factor domain-containing protein n=1 Tax=Exophiala xenobiotica TaxID=348802 RepID=A0A0D2ES83_9EURO|nr:uncharacterized protein PV05_03071 [Exophiala xenobiotica]KIW58563.1 hypothetical protein PV05_03071 [Exophiala xenobiotica]